VETIAMEYVKTVVKVIVKKMKKAVMKAIAISRPKGMLTRLREMKPQMKITYLVTNLEYHSYFC
jgi:hypothetical protein